MRPQAIPYLACSSSFFPYCLTRHASIKPNVSEGFVVGEETQSATIPLEACQVIVSYDIVDTNDRVCSTPTDIFPEPLLPGGEGEASVPGVFAKLGLRWRPIARYIFWGCSLAATSFT